MMGWLAIPVVAAIGLLVVYATARIGLAVAGRARTCPACTKKTLRVSGGDWRPRPEHGIDTTPRWLELTCGACQAAYVQPEGVGMVTREAWLAGAKGPIPTATAVRGGTSR